MYRFRDIKTQKGFTLIEMLIYIALLTLISSALVTTFLSLNTTLVRNHTERVLTQEARVALEHMLYSIRRADNVVDATGSNLELNGVFGTTRYYLSGNVLTVEDTSGNQSSLTSDAVTIENLNFTHYIGDSTDLVRVELTLSAESKASSSTRMYSISSVLRGSYE
jgi:prepilin-type N-terminal cleavage/methylation domain-containing protein